MIFTKPLTEQHGTGLLLIAMGIILKMLPDTQAPKRPTSSTAKPSSKGERALVEKMRDEEGEEKQPLV